MGARLTSTLLALLIGALPALSLALCPSSVAAHEYDHQDGAVRHHTRSDAEHSHDHSGSHEHAAGQREAGSTRGEDEDEGTCCQPDSTTPDSALSGSESTLKLRDLGLALAARVLLPPSRQMVRDPRTLVRDGDRSPYVRTRSPLLI